MRAAYLIHGFLSDRNDFARLAPLLTSRYDKVVCFNLPEHGFGQKHNAMNHAEIFEFVEGVFNELAKDYDTVDIFGFSMGGALASMLASTKKVSRLVLLAPANKYFAPTYPVKLMKYYAGYNKYTKREKAGKKQKKNIDFSYAEAVKADAKFAVELFRREIWPLYKTKSLLEFNKLIRLCNKRITAIYCPTLILYGQFDQLVPESTVKYLLRFCKNETTRAIIYPDISHLMLYSLQFNKIVDDILRFLEDTDPPKLEYRTK